MKISKGLFLLAIIISIISAGCTNKTTNPIENDISKEIPVEKTKKENIEIPEEPFEVAEEPVRKLRPIIVDPFLEKFPPGFTATDLGLYIRDNIANASEEEADKMIEFLLIYQEDMISNFDSKIWEDEYQEVFMDMDGISLDNTHINNIENEVVKNDFIDLINAFLILEDYFNYPVTLTNWDELFQYSSYLSDDFKKIIELHKKVNNYEYDRSLSLDVAGLSKDIIIIEEILKRSESAFIRREGNDLYGSLTGYLLQGPENSYLDHYTDKNTKVYKSLMSLKTKYPDSILKEIIKEIDSIEVEDIDQIVEIIWRKFEFGINSDSYIEITNTSNEKGEYELLETRMPSNIEKQNQINHIIRTDTEEFIQATSKGKPFNLSIEPGFQNSRYISYSGYLAVGNSDEDKQGFDLYRTLDYIEGKYVTLEDYFDADFTFIQEYVESVSGEKIETLPEFELTETGIILYVDLGGDSWMNNIFLKHKDLLQYFTLEELLDNN